MVHFTKIRQPISHHFTSRVLPLFPLFVANLFTIQQGSGRKFTFCGFLGLVSTSMQIWVPSLIILCNWQNIHQPENTSNISRIYFDLFWQTTIYHNNLPAVSVTGSVLWVDQLDVIRNACPFRPFPVLRFGTSQLFDLELSQMIKKVEMCIGVACRIYEGLVGSREYRGQS